MSGFPGHHLFFQTSEGGPCHAPFCWCHAERPAVWLEGTYAWMPLEPPCEAGYDHDGCGIKDWTKGVSKETCCLDFAALGRHAPNCKTEKPT